MRTNKVNDIEQLMLKLNKKDLCEFIREECANDRQFTQRFLAYGAGTILTQNYEDYKSRVEEIIQHFEGKHGYVEYRDTFELNRAICRVIDEADVAMSIDRWEVAVAILEGVAAAGEDIISCGDDSAGELSSIMNECFSKWHELCCAEQLPPVIASKIFELSMANFTGGTLKGYNWWWDWIKMAISLSDTSEKREFVIKELDKVINTQGVDWSDKYNIQEAQRYKLEILSKCGAQEEQRKFMYNNVSNPDFRRRLLQMAWDEDNYREVLRLAKDGVAHDSNYCGLVNEWHKWEFKTYRLMNNKANTLKLSRYFFFNGGRFGEREYSIEAMYAFMKSYVTNEEWSDFVNSLLKEALKKSDEVREIFIYTQEKMWDRYMELLRKSPSIYKIDDVPKDLWNLYKVELIGLYTKCVRGFFHYASDRNSYREGVVILKNLIKYGGKKEADDIIVEQKNRKPLRPALIDELSKL